MLYYYNMNVSPNGNTKNQIGLFVPKPTKRFNSAIYIRLICKRFPIDCEIRIASRSIYEKQFAYVA